MIQTLCSIVGKRKLQTHLFPALGRIFVRCRDRALEVYFTHGHNSQWPVSIRLIWRTYHDDVSFTVDIQLEYWLFHGSVYFLFLS